jgi:hypothetical protein
MVAVTEPSRCYLVTPSLMLDGASLPQLSGIQHVAAVQAAVAVIEDRGIAVLPADAWSLADRVLAALGLDEFTRRDRLHMARFGETLGAV